jgi:predicted phage terminase large subunit-like protein
MVPIVWPQGHPKEGLPTWPSGPYGTLEEIEKLERKMSSYIWATQYLCNPLDPKEAVFDTSWICYYPSLSAVPKLLYKAGMMDLALSLDKGACYTSAVIVGVDEEGNWYILDALRDHLDTDGQLDLFFQTAELHKPQLYCMENVLFQEKMLDVVRRDPRFKLLSSWGVAFDGIEPLKGEKKEQRIESLQPRFRNKIIYMRKDQVDLFRELAKYRRSTAIKRDLLDALSYMTRIIPDIYTPKKKMPIPPQCSFDDGIPYEDIENAILLGDEADDIFAYTMGKANFDLY